ncbi:MAG: c-type cytochrome biogenesis protein CcmI [Paracoccaceae bacterium]|nr:c-type cytochrome biogenesis protein CcmI [Paracoccaceae bacterium]
MLGFWIIATATAVATIAIIGRALVTGQGGGAAADNAAYDVQVYRDQLSELDRDVARGVIGEEEAERARVETSRRLLEADRKARGETGSASAPPTLTWAVLALSTAVILGGGIWLYSLAGAPGTPDLPLEMRKAAAETARESRPTQAALEADLPHWTGPPPEAPPDYIEMVDKLRVALADRPGDLEGQKLLAQHEAALGNYRAAHQAMARVIEIKGAEAAADDYTQYADLMVLAAHGRVSPEAETAVKLALEIDPGDPIALYYVGLMYGQNDRPDLAFPIWRDLLESSHAGEPWVEPIRGQIGQLAAMAGVDYTPPAARAAAPLAGPTLEDMDAAADMTDAERGAFVQGMVDRLMERLATEGGTAQEWAQLIGALAILGDTERARGIWGEAQAVFAEIPEARALIDETAANAGLSDPLAFDPDAPAPATPAPDPAAAADPHGQEAVARLMDRLAEDGGTPAEWAQLIGALAVQGDSENARRIWGEAQSVFAQYPEAVAMIDRAATQAGLTDPIAYDAGTAPAALPGPTADDIAAAAEMDDEDRAAMIDGMVTRLSDELASIGGPPEKWVMLINSLGQLGETDRAAAVWAEAQKYFAEDPAGLAAVRPAAEALGVAE